jgi:MSHA pilin protein MshC
MWIRRESGFTIFEIVVVLIVMSIITAFAIGRGLDPGTELSVQTEVLKTQLRHAQSRALNSTIPWGIRTNATGDVYWLFKYEAATVTSVRLPGEENTTVNLAPKGITITVGTYSFDDRGRPYYTNETGTPAATGTALSDLGADQTITLLKSGVTETVTITKNTGFIP